MANNVFILGAGASAGAGVPVMRDFLEVAHDLLDSNKVGTVRAEFDRVFDALRVLPQVHSKAMLDVDNVESVFSAFEMARIIGVLGDYDEQRINELDAAMRMVIAETIEQTLLLPCKGIQEMPPGSYYEFASLLLRMRSGYPKHQPSVITFNYDLAVDYALQFVSYPVIYGFAEDDPGDGIPLLKLHGSLNWGACSECGAIVPWRMHKFFQWRGSHRVDRAKSVPIGLTSKLREFKHHDKPVSSIPVIVPPTWGKTSQHLNLAKVWQRAARTLQAAENIFVIGYSLPPSDAFFKYLYALGTVGPTRIRRFWVFDPAAEVEKCYKELLGQAVQGKFRFYPVKFEEAIKIISKEFPTES